jgi:hypothetical protein
MVKPCMEEGGYKDTKEFRTTLKILDKIKKLQIKDQKYRGT